MSNYQHINFASEEMSVALCKLPSMRWREQQEMLESIIEFHALDIEPCDFRLGAGQSRAANARDASGNQEGRLVNAIAKRL